MAALPAPPAGALWEPHANQERRSSCSGSTIERRPPSNNPAAAREQARRDRLVLRRLPTLVLHATTPPQPRPRPQSVASSASESALSSSPRARSALASSRRAVAVMRWVSTSSSSGMLSMRRATASASSTSPRPISSCTMAPAGFPEPPPGRRRCQRARPCTPAVRMRSMGPTRFAAASPGHCTTPRRLVTAGDVSAATS